MSKTLGDAFVRVRPDTDQFADEAHSRMSGGLKKLALGIGSALASKKVYEGAKALVDRASDLSEEGSKAGVVFGKAEGIIKRFARTGLESIGQTQHSILQAAGTFGVFGKAAKLNDRENAKFSKSLVKLSSDLASFSNTTPEEAIQALGSGLRGEAEPLRKYGILLDDATLKARALALGILKPVKDQDKIKAYHANVLVAQKAYNDAVAEFGPKSLEAIKAQAKLGTTQSSLEKATAGTIPTLTGQQKVLAAQAEIMAQTSLAQGDFKRTSEGFANQQRIAAAQSETLKTKIGQGLLPVFVAGSQILTKRVMPPLIDLADKYVPRVSRGIAKWIREAPIDKYLDTAGDALRRVKVHLSGMDASSAAGTLESVKVALRGIDWREMGASVSSMAESGKALAPAFAGVDLSGINDLFSVTAEVMAYAADHTDKLAKLLPWLAGGFISLKVAQAMANAAQLVSLPLKVAEVVVNRQLIKSNKALIVSRTADTVAMTANTTAENVSTVAKIRGRIATIAGTVATKVAAGATWLWTGAMKVLNLVMMNNPLGWVLKGIMLLVGGLVIAYNKSETFRKIVDGAFRAVGKAASWLWNDVLKPVLALIGDGFGWLIDKYAWVLDKLSKVPGFGWAEKAADALRAAGDKARGFGDDVKDIPAKKDVAVNITRTIATHVKAPKIPKMSPAQAKLFGDAYGQVAFGEGYEIVMAGSRHAKLKGPDEFDSGGIARGMGYMPKKIIKPERVLSPRQTEAFERLVDALERGGLGRGGHTFQHYGDVVAPEPKKYLEWNQNRSRAVSGGGVDF